MIVMTPVRREENAIYKEDGEVREINHRGEKSY